MIKPAISQAYVDEIAKWRAQMDESIRAENSWLALAGLFWLEEGEQALIRAADGTLLLADGQEQGWISSFSRRGDRVHLEPNLELDLTLNGKPAQAGMLSTDLDAEPDFITLDDLRIVVIQRGERVGLRIWDNGRSERTTYPHRIWYPLDQNYHIRAKILSVDPEQKVTVPDVLGGSSEEKVVGEVVFTVAGRQLRLHALEAGEGRGLIIFADETNGRTTYPGGRFVVVEIGDASEVAIDFNRAFNPPCAFTPHATCPLPPGSNRLPIGIPAGEQYLNSPQAH